MTDLLTPVATLAFTQNLITAKEVPGKPPKFECVLLFPKTTNIDTLRALAKVARDERWPNEATRPKGLKPGIKDGDVPNGNGNIPTGFAGHWVVNVGSLYAPKLLDENVRPVLVGQKEKFYPGCKVIALVNCYPYPKEGAVDQNNKGIAFGLQALQFAGDGPKLVEAVDVSKSFSPVPGSAAAGAAKTGDSASDWG